MQNEKGEFTWHQWNPETKGWDDTAIPSKAKPKEKELTLDGINKIIYLNYKHLIM